MNKKTLEEAYIKYCESLKTRGVRFIVQGGLDKSEYLKYSLIDLRDAILSEQNEHIRNVLLVLMYLKVEEQNPAKVEELALLHTRN